MRTTRRRSFSRLVLSTLALIALLAFRVTGQEIPKKGAFRGDWSLRGTTSKVEMDGGEIAVYRLAGPVTIRSGKNLPRELQSECIGVSDEKNGGTGRCRWTDDEGDVLVLELSGRIVGYTGTVREANGRVIGGTGKYAGMEGEFKVDWLFLESRLEKGKVIARDTEFTGSWRRP